MAETQWLNEAEERAWRALQFMQVRLDGALARQLAADSELSYIDYQVLVTLTDVADGRRRQFEIARILGWEKSRLSHHIARMVDRGLVARERCDSDRRGAFIVITDRGRAAQAAAAPGHVAAVRRLFLDHVTAGELEVMAAASERVLAAFEGGPPSGDGHA